MRVKHGLGPPFTSMTVMMIRELMMIGELHRGDLATRHEARQALLLPDSAPFSSMTPIIIIIIGELHQGRSSNKARGQASIAAA
jgi:hypothetical protein